MAARPHILLVDLPHEAHDRLAGRGCSVQRGTLGSRWKVDPDANLLPVGLEQAYLPDRTEQDVIIADFAAELRSGPPPVTWPPQGAQGFYQSMIGGIVDFRPRVAVALKRDWQRIFNHGGVFCVFAEHPSPVEYILGEEFGGGVRQRQEVKMRL